MGRLTGTRITARVADDATAEVDEYVWDAQQVGLGLRVLSSGRKTWVYRFRLGRRQTIAKLGTYRDSRESDVVMAITKVRAIARRWRAALDEGKDPRLEHGRSGETMAGYWDGFITHKREREGLSPSTLKGYESHWRVHLANKKYGIALLPARTISRRDIVRLQHAVADQGRSRAAAAYEAAVEAERDEEVLQKLERDLPTAGNGAANSLMRTISSLFSWLVAIGELDHSPCDKLPTLPTSGRDPESILDREDTLEALRIIREHATHDGHRDMLLLLIYTAQRKADIRLRRWEDLELDDPDVPMPYFRIEQHKSRRRTRAAKRVPLGPHALRIVLERYPGCEASVGRASDANEWVVVIDGATWPLLPSKEWAQALPPAAGPIFPGDDPAKPLADAWHAWKRIATHATRKRVRATDVHGLRHAASSMMLAADVPKDLIQLVLHHAPSSGPSVTDRYLHETFDVYKRLGEFLSEME